MDPLKTQPTPSPASRAIASQKPNDPAEHAKIETSGQERLKATVKSGGVETNSRHIRCNHDEAIVNGRSETSHAVPRGDRPSPPGWCAAIPDAGTRAQRLIALVYPPAAAGDDFGHDRCRQKGRRLPAEPLGGLLRSTRGDEDAQMKDLLIILDAMKRAQAELAAYVRPGDRNAELTIAKLVAILKNREVVQAINAVDPKVPSPTLAPGNMAEAEKRLHDALPGS
jgi:hypothetical protein